MISSIVDSLKAYSPIKKEMIYESSLNTDQLVMLSGIDGLNNNSIEKTLGEKFSEGMSHEATFSKRSAS